MSNEVEIHRVTEDPELENQLIERFSTDADSFALARHAYSLGLFPPGYEEGQEHSIALVWPPGADPMSDPGMLVWDTSNLGGGSAEQFEDDEEDGPDGWDDVMVPPETSGT